MIQNKISRLQIDCFHLSLFLYDFPNMIFLQPRRNEICNLKRLVEPRHPSLMSESFHLNTFKKLIRFCAKLPQNIAYHQVFFSIMRKLCIKNFVTMIT